MENMIIAQNQDTVINLRHVYMLKVCASKTEMGKYDITAVTTISSDEQCIGTYSKKEMAIDVRNDILLWNNQNFDWEWHIEYPMPLDNPLYESSRDAMYLLAARKNKELQQLHQQISKSAAIIGDAYAENSKKTE